MVKGELRETRHWLDAEGGGTAAHAGRRPRVIASAPMRADRAESTNIDHRVVEDFGEEWSRFDQTKLGRDELQEMFESYFGIFPWEELPEHAVGFDLGCGSGRWAKLVATRVAHLHLIDPSEKALSVAKRNLQGMANASFHHAGVDAIPLPDASMDFGYSLGVLHHVPDTAAGIRACVRKLKPGAPLLLYLYYAFDNRPFWYIALWRVSEIGRRVISVLPHFLKVLVCQLIALLVYLPLARTARFLERRGIDVSRLPLNQYRNNSLYTLRTDALDRFGTKLEQRFSRAEIEKMMEEAGLGAIEFSERMPHWCAVGRRRP